MIQLFKAKSLKSNTKTEQGAGVRGAGVGAGTQEAGNKNAKKQRGRSMVEMLGVLAIIGVLSIGGIQGYTMAMRRYRANEILNIVQKYAMTFYSSCQQAIQQNPQEYGIMQEDTNYIGYDGDFKNIWYCPKLKFTDAGLGPLPNGVLNIGYNAAHDSVSIKSLSSGDAVVIAVEFETQELCESVMSITGKATINDVEWGCEPAWLGITVMMN